MNLSKKFDEVLTTRLALWIVSVAIASSMWFFTLGDRETGNETLKLLTRIEYLNLQPQVTVRSAVSEVLIEIEAPVGVIENIAYDTIVGEVDLRGLSSGRFRSVVRPRLPPNVVLRSITPSELDVELVRQITRMFTVEVALPQDIPSGHYLEAVEVVPREVSIRGTEADVAKIGSVSVTPTFDELQIGQDLLLPVSLAQSIPFEDGIVLEPPMVRVSANLVSGMPRKRVPVNVRLVGSPSSDFAVRALTTDPAEVMLEGERESLDRISAVYTETIDITDLSASQTMVVPLRAFEEEDVSANVSAVTFSVQLEPIVAQKHISNVAVILDGVEEGDSWAVNPSVVSVVIEAPPSVIDQFAADEQLRAFVDMSGIFLRRAVLPVWAVTESEDFRVVRVEPFTVTVTALEE